MNDAVYILSIVLFFLYDTSPTEIYTYGHTLSLHDALPIWRPAVFLHGRSRPGAAGVPARPEGAHPGRRRDVRPEHAPRFAGYIGGRQELKERGECRCVS